MVKNYMIIVTIITYNYKLHDKFYSNFSGYKLHDNFNWRCARGLSFNVMI